MPFESAATLPTLNLLIEKGARVILAAHLGRPDGKREPSLSLKPVAEKLSELLGKPVTFVDECVGEKAEAAAKPSGEKPQKKVKKALRRKAGEAAEAGRTPTPTPERAKNRVQKYFDVREEPGIDWDSAN